MLSLRPKPSPLYLERPRLLNQLPDDVGHVVHLEAPYGYGKSILAAQYAEHLEQQDWRVVWAESSKQNAQEAIATALNISTDAPWQLLLTQLWQEETLLVLEDLEGSEDLNPLLENPKGIVLLASRNQIENAELLKLSSQNRCTHLDAPALALNLEESQALIIEPQKAQEIWELTGGWALPLHFSALTGQAPDANSLLAGIKASLEDEVWQELLFLAALDYLPESAMQHETQLLVSKGFVQQLESSFRLHIYVAEMIRERYSQEVSDAVKQQASRLPLLLQGKAYAACQLFELLEGILEASDAELWREDPQALLVWDGLVKEIPSAHRYWSIGAAHSRLGNVAAAVESFDKALAQPNLSAHEQLGIMRDFCMPLGFHDQKRGLSLIAQGEQLLEQVDPELVGRFLANTSFIHLYAEDFDKAIEAVDAALSFYPEASKFRVGALINKALFEFDARGNFDLRLNTQLETLERVQEVFPVQALGQCRDLGSFHLWLADTKKARYFLELARDGEAINPAVGIEARATLAYLDFDAETLAKLCHDAKAFPNPYVSDVVSMYKIRLDNFANNSEAAKYSYEQSSQGAFSRSAYALTLAKEENLSEALTLLNENYASYGRTETPYVMAARYLISNDEADLSQFLDLTSARERLLPGFIPLNELPKRPELTAHYPIHEVLDSGWQEAIEYRKEDIPELRLTLLGDLQAHSLGNPLELTDRQKQILTLLSIGKSRDEVAEAMWSNVDAKKQRNNLNVQLNLLRKVIEPWGVSTYLFEEGLRNTNSDYQKLREAIKQSNAEQIFELYQEPLAPGLHLDALSDLREQLREDVVNLLFEASEQTPNPQFLKRILELEPLHEEALQALLKELTSKGRKREAKQRYQKFAKLLKTDMGLEPTEETKELINF